MNLRTDDERSALSEELRTGSSSLRHEELLSAAAYQLGHEESFGGEGKTLLLRPIRADDARLYEKMINASDASSVDFRFPRSRRPLSGSALARCTQIDYEREMAFVAADENGTEDELFGEVRISVFPGSDAAEFAIFVHPQARRQGIGRALLLKMIRYCSRRGFSEIIGQIAPENEHMLALARKVGMHIHRAPGAGIAVAHLKLLGSVPIAHSANADSATPVDPSAAEGATARHRPTMKMTAPPLRRRTLSWDAQAVARRTKGSNRRNSYAATFKP